MSKHVFDRDAWAQLDVFNQMGNIGSEVGRALVAKHAGKTERSMSAFYRGIDLINATVEAWVSRGKSPRELLIAREQFAQSILTENEDATLEKYFMQFALAARANR
jgi:hypothetical protein